jgi:cytochrome P450
LRELFGISFFFLVAGHETTVGGITFMLWRLGLRPDQRARLLADRSLIPRAIEEALRIDSPVIHLARAVTEDTVLGGAAMKAGNKVMVLYAAANLDDDAFPQADQLLLDRTGNPAPGVRRRDPHRLVRGPRRLTRQTASGALPAGAP